MANPLPWNAGEGFDLHVLRNSVPSKSLVGALNLPAFAALPTLQFTPLFASAPSNFGVTVDQSTGAVTALPPPPNSSRTEINNFIIAISIQDGHGTRFETEIRVHVHNSVADIWLTPRTLTIHKDADECRFTVLASFDDGTVGDITDWPLTYRSRVPGTQTDSTDVLVAANGTLKAITAAKSAEVTVNLTVQSLTTPTNLTSAKATVVTKRSWTTEPVDVEFVETGLRPRSAGNSAPQKDGTVIPNKNDPNSNKLDSVASVVANATNILFVSEGFSRKSDFRTLVNKIVDDFRTQDHLQPFKLLQDAINYWAVFVPSQDDGVTLLGEYALNLSATKTRTRLLPTPAKPPPAAPTWSLEQIVHEVGLPIATDPTTLNAIEGLWKLRYGNRDYQTLAGAKFADWRALAEPSNTTRIILNERDSAFGLVTNVRPSAVFGSAEVERGLGSTTRRTSDATIQAFIANLTYGKDPVTGATFNIGSTWKPSGNDANLVCFLCLTERHAGHAYGGYFLSSTGRTSNVTVNQRSTLLGAISAELDVPLPAGFEVTALSTTVVHEFGHMLGLADEYGDGGGTFADIDHQEPNLCAKSLVATTTAVPNAPARVVYDKTMEIKWRWPRLAKAGLLTMPPQRSGNRFIVPLRNGHGTPFAVGDVVAVRESPVRLRPSLDPFASFAPGMALMVVAHTDNTVELSLVVAADGTSVDLDQPVPWGVQFLALFQPKHLYALVCPRRAAGAASTQLTLVAEPIRTRIAATHRPLNAPAPAAGTAIDHETVACQKAGYMGADMTPTNLPSLSTKPRNLFSIVGLYDGGGGHDCGVFRPAGRCKMRNSNDATVPFCHVCRYVLVDRLDPTKHGELDKLYPEVAP